jgi:hypothetical protein
MGVSHQVLRKPCDGTPKATKATAKIIPPTINVKTCVSMRMARMRQVLKKSRVAFLPFTEPPRRNKHTN